MTELNYIKAIYCHPAYLTYMLGGGGGLVTKSCPTLMTPRTATCQASVHWILQARILELTAISFSRGIFPTQRSNPGLLHCRQIHYRLSYKGSPIAEYIMLNASLDETQARIKIARRKGNDIRYAGDTTLMEESEEELKSLLIKVKESEKADFKLNIQKPKVMTFGLITSWHGETMETVTDFIFLSSKTTMDSDCSHEIKGRFNPGRKAMTNLDSVFKS